MTNSDSLATCLSRINHEPEFVRLPLLMAEELSKHDKLRPVRTYLPPLPPSLSLFFSHSPIFHIYLFILFNSSSLSSSPPHLPLLFSFIHPAAQHTYVEAYGPLYWFRLLSPALTIRCLCQGVASADSGCECYKSQHGHKVRQKRTNTMK